jgi:hypothetical protein
LDTGFLREAGIFCISGKNISVISAEKTEWVGGRAGVKGIMYTVKLKKKIIRLLL